VPTWPKREVGGALRPLRPSLRVAGAYMAKREGGTALWPSPTREAAPFGPYGQKRALAFPLAIPPFGLWERVAPFGPYDQKSVWPSLRDRTAPSAYGRPSQRGTAPLNASLRP
jgi:hypothetical protein